MNKNLIKKLITIVSAIGIISMVPVAISSCTPYVPSGGGGGGTTPVEPVEPEGDPDSIKKPDNPSTDYKNFAIQYNGVYDEDSYFYSSLSKPEAKFQNEIDPWTNTCQYSDYFSFIPYGDEELPIPTEIIDNNLMNFKVSLRNDPTKSLDEYIEIKWQESFHNHSENIQECSFYANVKNSLYLEATDNDLWSENGMIELYIYLYYGDNTEDTEPYITIPFEITYADILPTEVFSFLNDDSDSNTVIVDQQQLFQFLQERESSNYLSNLKVLSYPSTIRYDEAGDFSKIKSVGNVMDFSFFKDQLPEISFDTLDFSRLVWIGDTNQDLKVFSEFDYDQEKFNDDHDLIKTVILSDNIISNFNTFLQESCFQWLAFNNLHSVENVVFSDINNRWDDEQFVFNREFNELINSINTGSVGYFFDSNGVDPDSISFYAWNSDVIQLILDECSSNIDPSALSSVLFNNSSTINIVNNSDDSLSYLMSNFIQKYFVSSHES